MRHRCRARCDDRIRNAKDTGLTNLPLHGFGQNRIWCQIVATAADLMVWMGLLGTPAGGRATVGAQEATPPPALSIQATTARTGRRTILPVSDRPELYLTARPSPTIRSNRSDTPTRDLIWTIDRLERPDQTSWEDRPSDQCWWGHLHHSGGR